MQQIAITTTSEKFLDKAKLIAYRLGMPVISIDNKDFEFLFVITESRLELRENTKKSAKPIFVDFLHGPINYRIKHGGGRKQLLAKAIGVNKKQLKVLDVTAGFGKDAFVLANLGCDVLMLERSKIIAALLLDGLERLKADKDFAKIKLDLLEVDAKKYLENLADDAKPDVIYLDPMYPDLAKTALSKKEMRILRCLVGDDVDAFEIFELARNNALNRVVVKRPRLAKTISDDKPDVTFIGKSSRFDVYFT